MAVILGMSLLRGNVPDEELSPLPQGWRYIKAKECWLLVEGPDKQRYYVGKGRLYPQRTRKEIGTFYVDDLHPIEIPQIN